MHNRHYLLLPVFFLLYLPCLSTSDLDSFVMFPICARRIEKKKISFNHDVDEHLSREKKYSVLSNLLDFSMCIIDRSVFPDYNKSSSHSLGRRHRNHISKKSFPLSRARSFRWRVGECGKEDIIPRKKKLPYIVRAETVRELFLYVVFIMMWKTRHRTN
jgi:hypothetical protein